MGSRPTKADQPPYPREGTATRRHTGKLGRRAHLSALFKENGEGCITVKTVAGRQIKRMPSEWFVDSAVATTPQISRIVHSPSPQSRKVPGVSVVAAAEAAVEDQAATDLGAIVR